MFTVRRINAADWRGSNATRIFSIYYGPTYHLLIGTLIGQRGTYPYLLWLVWGRNDPEVGGLRQSSLPTRSDVSHAPTLPLPLFYLPASARELAHRNTKPITSSTPPPELAGAALVSNSAHPYLVSISDGLRRKG